MLQAALASSEVTGRLVKLQSSLTALVPFYAGTRPGSMAATAKVFRDRGSVSTSILSTSLC